MYRVSQFFWIYNGNSLREPIKGLYVGPAEKRSFMVVRRRCRFVKDYGSRENYEKSFSVHNDEINDILKKLGVNSKSIPNYKIDVRLEDEIINMKMTMNEAKYPVEKVK